MPAASALFLILPSHLDKDGRAIVFDYESARPIGRYGVEKGKRRIPLVQWGGDSQFTPLLGDMALLEGKKGAFQGPAGAGFVSADDKGNSLWSEKTDSGETILMYSKDGQLLSQGYIAFQGDLPATGFWTTADDKLTVYKNYFFKDHMLIVGYGFGKR